MDQIDFNETIDKFGVNKVRSHSHLFVSSFICSQYIIWICRFF